ncbi:MAG: hypothetical protein HRU03_02055, partial [Nanoarchaeales archaeon]|nr:hypothetical protein [Nanoarchaeales archaeon]
NFGFLEIDFFNAFNTYFFPNEVDSFYNKIIDTMFEVANKYIMTNPKIFKTLNIGIMGDEMFFIFLKSEKFTNSESNLIQEFLMKINYKILHVTATNLLIKTQKKNMIKTQKEKILVKGEIINEKQITKDKMIIKETKQEVTIRVPIEKENLFSSSSFEIGKISVSKYLMINYQIKLQNNDTVEFKKIYEHLDLKIKEVKKIGKSEFLVEDMEKIK